MAQIPSLVRELRYATGAAKTLLKHEIKDANYKQKKKKKSHHTVSKFNISGKKAEIPQSEDLH